MAVLAAGWAGPTFGLWSADPQLVEDGGLIDADVDDGMVVVCVVMLATGWTVLWSPGAAESRLSMPTPRPLTLGSVMAMGGVARL